MFTILGGLAVLWLLLMILGVAGLILGMGMILGVMFKLIILISVTYVCVRLIAKILGFM